MNLQIIGARFDEERLTYCTYDQEINLGDLVIVDLDGFSYAGTVEKIRAPRENENMKIYNVIKCIATPEDIQRYNDTLKKDMLLVGDIQKETEKLKLNMTVFRVMSSLDGSKVKIMYTSQERVDFRDLLKTLASKLHARLELRQVGPRDRAKMIGGIGICGRPLCCSSFLSAFDGISISMAKNQMLSINIPKLSGQCGKLICCLKYENSTYSEEKKGFPKFGDIVKYEKADMKIIGFNILNKTITLSNREGRVTISLDEYNKLLNKPDDKTKKKYEYTPVNSSSFKTHEKNANESKNKAQNKSAHSESHNYNNQGNKTDGKRNNRSHSNNHHSNNSNNRYKGNRPSKNHSKVKHNNNGEK